MEGDSRKGLVIRKKAAAVPNGCLCVPLHLDSKLRRMQALPSNLKDPAM